MGLNITLQTDPKAIEHLAAFQRRLQATVKPFWDAAAFPPSKRYDMASAMPLGVAFSHVCSRVDVLQLDANSHNTLLYDVAMKAGWMCLHQ